MLGSVALLVLFAICCPFPAAAQRTLAVVGGAVIDGTGAPPRLNAAIVIEGDRIRAVGPAADVQIPPGAEMVDASGKWIIPGLIDAHVHFGQWRALHSPRHHRPALHPALCGGDRADQDQAAGDVCALPRQRPHGRGRCRRSHVDLRCARARPQDTHRAARCRGRSAARNRRPERAERARGSANSRNSHVRDGAGGGGCGSSRRRRT